MNYLVLLILFIPFLHSQTLDYSIIIKKPFSESLVDITQDYDKKLTVVGFAKPYNFNKKSTKTFTDAFEYLDSFSNRYGSQIKLIKIDDNANILFTKTNTLNRFNEAVSIVKTPTNGYFIGGYTLDGSLLLLKVDSNGDTIFQNIFGTKNYDRLENIIALNDGGVLTISSSKTTRSPKDNLFETGLGLNDIYLTRFTKDGAKLWSKKYGTNLDDKGIDIVEANDGSIIVVGMSYDGAKKDMILMRLNEDGDKIWLKHYGIDYKTKAHKIIKLKDDTFLVSATYKDNKNKEQIQFIKFDLQKNILLDKIIKLKIDARLNDIEEFSNGNIVGVGYKSKYNDKDALAIIFNKNLDILYKCSFGDKNYDLFNALTIMDNSQIAIAGLYTENESQISNMWVMKLNKDCTIARKSILLNDLYSELIILFKDEIKKNNLRITKKLEIEFITKDLYFKVAKYKLTNYQKKFLKKFSDKLFPLLKKYQSTITNIEINGHTSSEWGKVDFTNRYLKNEKLSMNRAYAVLEFIFKNQNLKTKRWLTKVLKSSGYSSSKKIKYKNSEDKKESRRVSFKILNDTKSN